MSDVRTDVLYHFCSLRNFLRKVERVSYAVTNVRRTQHDIVAYLPGLWNIFRVVIVVLFAGKVIERSRKILCSQ